MTRNASIALLRSAGEQAPELARRLFGLPLGLDPEAADVLRYYFEHQLGHEKGVLPAALKELALPTVAELFRLYRTRALGERPTGRWTTQRRRAGTAKKPPGASLRPKR